LKRDWSSSSKIVVVTVIVIVIEFGFDHDQFCRSGYGAPESCRLTEHTEARA